MSIHEDYFQAKTLKTNIEEDEGEIHAPLLPKYFEPLQEKENKVKVKEYNIIEVLNLPINTELKAIFKDGTESLSNIIVSKVNNNEKTLRFKINNEICHCDEMFITAKFIKVQTVTFQEALESGKKVRLTNDYNLCFETNEEYLNNLIKLYNKGKYMYIDELLCILSYYYPTLTVRRMFTEKCWLIEED